MSENKYFEVQKYMIEKANGFKGVELTESFDWKFVDSLTNQFQERQSLSAKQFTSLKKVVYRLGILAGTVKPKEAK